MRVEIEREEQPQGGEAFIVGKVPGWVIVIGCIVSIVIPILGFFIIPFVIYDYFRFQKSQKSYHTVSIAIDFSEEEKHIIKSNRLEDRIIFERPLDALRQKSSSDRTYYESRPQGFWLSIRSVLDGTPDVYHAETPADARAYEQELESKLPMLKEFLEANVVREHEHGKRTLEF